MSKIIKRKEFEKVFLDFATKNKEIWAINKIKELSQDIFEIAIRLASLDFINYVRITGETLTASNQIKGTRIKEPITTMNHPTAIGIEIIYHLDYRVLDFNEINSTIKGHGSKMISAILTDLPKDWKLAVVMDWSGGFWEKMEEKYSDREWIM
jgi:hypothetical protein